MVEQLSPSNSTGSLEQPRDENDRSSTDQHRIDYYVATRKALFQMEASIQSVLSYLASEGLSQASLNQLSSSLRNGQHVSVMKSSQEYMRCTMVTTATLTVFLDAWHSVSTYLALLYRQAHSNYMQLRRSHKINMLAGALQKKMQLGELCCQAQKEGLLLERSKKQLAWKEEEQRQRQLQSCDGPAAPVRIA